jgi:hypothetical protein
VQEEVKRNRARSMGKGKWECALRSLIDAHGSKSERINWRRSSRKVKGEDRGGAKGEG